MGQRTMEKNIELFCFIPEVNWLEFLYIQFFLLNHFDWCF